MKKILMTALMGLTVGMSMNVFANEVVAAKEAVATVSLTAEEQAFAAKLDDQNRKVFATHFTAKQRADAMAFANCQGCSGKANPNEVVQKVAQEQNVAVAEKAEHAPAK